LNKNAQPVMAAMEQRALAMQPTFKQANQIAFQHQKLLLMANVGYRLLEDN